TILGRDRLLEYAVHKLADASITSEALYYAALLLGKLHVFILELQDHWVMLQYIWVSSELKPNITREPAALDWSALKAAGCQDHRLKSDNNSYGIENQYWDQYLPTWANARNTLSDAKYRDLLQNSKEWVDLDLLFRKL